MGVTHGPQGRFARSDGRVVVGTRNRARGSDESDAGRLDQLHVRISDAGVVSLKPGLGDTPSAKQIKVKSIIGIANGTSCDNSGVTAGTSKFPISAMTVKITAKTPVGGDCSTLLTAPGLTGKVQVKFLGLNPASKLATVAVVNTTIATTTASAAPPSIQIVTAPSTKGAFVGQTLTFTLNISGLTGGCTDADPLTAVSGTGTVTSP